MKNRYCFAVMVAAMLLPLTAAAANSPAEEPAEAKAPATETAAGMPVGSAGTKAAVTETPARDGRFVYVGRTLSQGDDVLFDWVGTTAKIRFSGSYLAVKCGDSKDNYFNVWVDKEPCAREDFYVHPDGKDTLMVLASGLKKGTHDVILQKRTEADQGRITLHSFLCDGEFLQAAPLKERHIEIVGDSYSCGYGTEGLSATEPFKPETENCNLTYAAILGRFFDADVNWVSHSGQGIVRNYADFDPGHHIPERYSQTLDNCKDYIWDASAAAYTPDIVIIMLGTNDFSNNKQPSFSSFQKGYEKLLGKIRANYGNEVPILCLAAKGIDGVYDYVHDVCRSSSVPNLYFMGMQDALFDNDTEMGSDWHPAYLGHRKIALTVLPYISTLTGWSCSLIE